MFLEWAYQCYNVIFTSVPVLVFAVLDWDLSAEELFNYPSIYSKTAHGELFNAPEFAMHLMFGLIQSLAVFGIPQAAFWSSAIDSTGQNMDLFTPGIAVYTCVVIVVNLKLALAMRSWTWLHHVAVWGSIVVYFFVMIILNASSVFGGSGADYYFLVFRVLGTLKFWLVVFVTVFAASGLDFGVNAYNQLKVKAYSRVEAAERARFKAQMKKLDMDTSGSESPKRKPTTPRPMEESPPDLALDAAHATTNESTALVPSLEPSSSVNGNASGGAVETHQRKPTHTGFDFDYTPGEAHRLSVRKENAQTQVRRTTLLNQSNPARSSNATSSPLLRELESKEAEPEPED